MGAVDDRGVLNESLEPLDLPLDKCLLVLGVFIFGVFGQVAMLLCVVDPLRDLLTPDADEFLEVGP
jgi:hypothetical protein